MKKLIVLVLFLMSIEITGCQQKDEPKPQYQFPAGPIQTQDDIKILQDAVKRDPANANAWIKIGNIMMDASRFKEAVDAYQKALDIEPDNVDVRVDMGTCYRNLGKSDRAVEEFRKALKINPDHLYGHRNLAVVLAFDQKDNVQAVKEFERYLELAPNAPDAADTRKLIQELKLGK